ncbi:hypothetical protein [Cryocola sp. 340MFSha3.1]|uniref:hypothetical protein n=1 Tax=Cryocola sp. 340MFSha3.1 TaxID=1169145 RepID=UPI000370F1BB|nr:hypothetical protein [Cryocola sp. 340MFSha3.1]
MITPASSSRRTRSATALFDMWTVRASSAIDYRPSRCSSARMLRSVLSTANVEVTVMA